MWLQYFDLVGPDGWCKNYDKMHLKELIIHLDKNVVNNISIDMKMSRSEIKTLKTRLYVKLTKIVLKFTFSYRIKCSTMNSTTLCIHMS